jgi:hypothetical protein
MWSVMVGIACGRIKHKGSIMLNAALLMSALTSISDHLQVFACCLVVHDVRGAAHIHAGGVRDLLPGGTLVNADAGHANWPWRIACHDTR